MFHPDSDEESNNSDMNPLCDEENGLGNYYLSDNQSFVLDRTRSEYFETEDNKISENLANVSNYSSRNFEAHQSSDL